MNDPAIFTAFVTNTLGVDQAVVRALIHNFVATFEELLVVTDDDIDTFVKDTHSANSARSAAQRVQIGTLVSQGLKSVLFELKDREICDSLPDANILERINADQLKVTRKNRADAKGHEKMRKAQSHPEMEVPKLTPTNWDEFDLAFTAAVRRQNAIIGIPLDYLLRPSDVGNYQGAWATREEKIKNCAVVRGQAFEDDSETLYNLLVQHIGSTGTGSNMVAKYKKVKNGRKAYLELKSHFKTASYEETKASAAQTVLKNAHFDGARRFTLQNYYDLITKAFVDLDEAGSVYALSEAQKINTFENGLREQTVISFSIAAKREWNQLPDVEQTFDAYYNSLSASYSRQQGLLHPPGSRVSQGRVSQLNVSQGGRYGGRGRGRGHRGRGRGLGRGHGTGRAGRAGRGGRNNNYSPYEFGSRYGAFVPEARVYPHEQWRLLSSHQKKEIQDLKMSHLRDSNWIMRVALQLTIHL